MIKKSKSTDSVGKQPEDQVVQAQVVQAKTGFAEAGSKSSHSVSSKDTAHGNKGKSVAKKTDEDELDLSLNTGEESAADPIVLAQAETGTATDAATAGSSSSAAGTAGGGAGSAAAGAATGAEGAGAFALSDAALGTMILAGTVGVAVIASTGGGAAAAAAPVTGFAISGTIALGKITDTTGLAVQAYKADGTALSTTSSVVNADGTYRINVGENYTGAILVRLIDTNPATNYFDEGTGTAKDIATDLRAVVYAAAGNGANVTVMLTPLTELAVRKLVGDTGGDAGASVTTLGASVAAVTSTQVSDANNVVKTAFGLAGDIVATVPVTVDNLTGTVNDYGQALAAISGLEKVQSTSTGQTVDTSQILNQLSLAIVTPAAGTSVLSQSAVDLLLQGAQQVQTAALATPANYATNTATTLATALTTVIGTSVTGLTLTVDTGAKDFITSSTAAHTISGTLGATLGTNKLWGSVDGGTTWTDITASVAGTTLTWNVGVLTGANVIKLAQTASTVTAFTGATTDLIANTKVAVQNYAVDTAAPAAPSVAVVTGAADATAAEATAGAVTVNAEKLSSVAVTFTGTAGNVTKTITGSGAAQAVALTAGDLTTLGEGAVGVSAVATDIAGNVSAAAGTGSFNLDTVLPSFSSATAANFAENTATATAAYTAAAADVNTVTYSLGGADAALFSIDAATGAVTFKATPNFEAPADAGANNVYDLTVTATDVAGNASSQAVAITVTNVNEMPMLTSGTVASFAENSTGTAYTVTATDPEAAAMTYALAGADAALFNINATTGAVTFATAPNREAPADAGGNNVYDITVTASDDTNTTAAQAVAITVTNVNEAPTLTGPASTTTLAVNQLFSDNVSSLFTDVDGDALTYSATGLPTGITLNTTTGAIGGTPTATGTATVVITATDSGGLNVSHTETINVVTAPVISSIASSVAQAKSGDALTFTATISEAVTVTGTPTLTLDVGGTAMTATYTGGTGTAALTFTATTPATGDDATVTVTAINLNGGSVIGNTTTQPLVDTTTGQVVTAFVVDNSNPVFTSAATANAAENQTAAYTSATTDGTAVTYTLGGGADAALFNINASTGAVTFKAAPNFEVPTDAGANNVYDITVTATDALGHASNQAAAITVTNVNEAPTVASGVPTTDTLVIGQALSGKEVASLFADVDASDTLTYSQTGLPTELTLNPSTGVITGTPVTHNITDITFTATDSGGLTTSHTIAVSFVSAPTLTSTIDNVTNFDVTSNIVMTASENVTAVANKYIHIINDANDATKAGFHSEATTNTQDILVTSAAVTITNNTITINPGFDLDLSNNYHITVDAGAFVNAGSVASVAVSDVAAINFSTVTPGTAVGGVAGAAASQKMGASDAMTASYSWWDIETLGSTISGSVSGDLSAGNIAVVFKDYDPLAGAANIGYTGIGSPGDDYVSLLSFGSGDLLYVDNQTNAAANDLTQAAFNHIGVAPVQLQFDGYASQGGMPTWIDITTTAGTTAFDNAAALQSLLSLAYVPIVSA